MSSEEYKYNFNDPLMPMTDAERRPLLTQDELDWLKQHGYGRNVIQFLSYALSFPSDAKKHVAKLDELVTELIDGLGPEQRKLLDTPPETRSFGVNPPDWWTRRN